MNKKSITLLNIGFLAFNIIKQCANGSYAETWFREATVRESTMPNK